MNYIDGGGDFNRDDPGGLTSASAFANMGWCAILTHLVSRTVPRIWATFAVFTGLLPPCYSLAALAKLPILTFSLMTRSVSVKTFPLMNPWRR